MPSTTSSSRSVPMQMLSLLGLVLVLMLAPALAIRTPAAAQPRRALQATTAPTPCTWQVGPASDGACDNYLGCCAPNPDYITAKFPGTFAAVALAGGACASVFEPTGLLSVKQADIDKCYSLGQRGQLCYVDFDPTTEQVSCQAITIWTGADAITGCPGSVAGNYAACLFSGRGQCTKGGNAGVCTNTFDDSYIKSLNKAQKTALAKVMGGPSLPKLRDMDSCKPTSAWRGAAMGDTTKPFASINAEFGTYISTLFRTSPPSQLYGSNCTYSAVKQRNSVMAKACYSILLDSQPNNEYDTNVSADQLTKCLSVPGCEVTWNPPMDSNGFVINGTVPKTSCQASVGRTQGLLYSATATEPMRTQIAAVFEACYAPYNRFSQTTCLAEQPYPQVYPEDFNTSA